AYGYVSGNPLSWTDWLGLEGTVWTGNVTKLGGSYGIGASIYKYELESTNPYTGHLIKVEVIATHAEAGVGTYVSGSNSEVVFKDDNLIPEPSVFEGTSMVAGISWSVVGGATFGANQLGEARQDMSLSFATGWDASVTVGLGTSRLLSTEYIQQYQCVAP
ncbi:hypothetical protein, partial [Saccharospirillum sp.]|uniref:hypothetical protein n=1 Tax=Saccharospirillum sp. TaxID=2033801 RepID=UPI0034A054DF